MGSYLEINLDKIRQNVSTVSSICRRYGVTLYGVTKVFCADPRIVKSFLDGGVAGLADSRIENIIKLKELNTGLPLMLLRLSSQSEARDVVTLCDLSLNSEISTLKALDRAAREFDRVHETVIMVDLGDLREGVLPDKLFELIAEAVLFKNLRIIGLGTNAACFGGVIPTPENMGQLLNLKHQVERKFKLKLPFVSGGNSSALPLLQSGKMPAGINNFRVGEAIALGRNVIDRSPYPGTTQDTFVFKGEIVEYRDKPSVPIGDRGQNAFGETEEFPERGIIRRAIVAAGRQDLKPDGMMPADSLVSVLGGSSDHLILEIRGRKNRYKVGDFLEFYPNYGSLLALMTSPYIKKVYV
ncbi:MAG: alanine/ornithine racemase family PLP-dependent enzyme [Candidatus Wallbacteria bacterium]|nr:alanine/ornithine racemase family PLP-dependent enzyme [Candidatus Wallbacteria bacterium]